MSGFFNLKTMATEKYVSEVKVIPHNQQELFEKLSNLENLNTLLSPENIEKAKQGMNGKVPPMDLKDFKADHDSCRFSLTGMGEVGMRIIEREAPKTIKLTGEGKVPFQFFIWIQLLPMSESQTKFRLTMHAELNPMIKMMVNKPLKEGINKLADAMAMIRF